MFKCKMKDNMPFSIGIKSGQKISYDLEYPKNIINQFDIERTIQ